MRDRIFNVWLEPTLVQPRFSQVRRQLIASGEGEKVIVIQDVYPEPEVHVKIPRICEAFVREAGVRLIAVEGVVGRLHLEPGDTSAEQLWRRYDGISKGVANAMLALPQVEFVGVEQLDQFKRGRAAMKHLEEPVNQTRYEQLFSRIRDLLRDLQDRFFSPEVATLRRADLAIYGEDIDLKERITLVKTVVQREGLATDDLPSLQAFEQAILREQQVDFGRAERERAVLVERLIDGIAAAFELPDGRMPRHCVSAVRFWATLIGVSNAELDAAFDARGVAAVLAECKSDLVSRVLRNAATVRHSGTASPEQNRFHEELLALASAVGMKTDDLLALRAYFDYVRVTAEGIDAQALLRESAQWAILMVERTKTQPQAQGFCAVEGRLNAYLEAILLKLPPDRAEQLDLQRDAFRDVFTDLRQFSPGDDYGALEQEIGALDAALSAAKEFYDTSLVRGGHMAREAVKAMRAKRVDRAVLVAGGFHPRSITASLEDERSVSWGVITPHFELSVAASRRWRGSPANR